MNFQPFYHRAILCGMGLLAVASTLLTSCGHGSSSLLPATSSLANARSGRSAQALGTESVSIHVGGGAVGVFAADEYGSGGNPASTSDTVNVSAFNSAPAAVYQTQRWGPMTYTIPGFTAGASYDVRLHFSEQYYGADGHVGGVGSRKFNVAINGTTILTNLDVYARAGGSNIALVTDATAVANSSGQMVIVFSNGAAENAMVDGIQVLPAGGLSDVTAIHVGGGAVGNFVADVDGSGGTIGTTTDSINVSATNAAPAAVYQTQRWGPMTYTIPGFTPGGSYDVRLHFAEQYYGADGRPGGAGSRQFNVAINGTNVLTNLDVYARAGAANKALVIDEPGTADASGRIVIAFSVGSVDNPMVDGIEILAPQLISAQAIHIGGGAVGSFVADVDGTGGNPASTSDAINVSAANAAPAAVYQTQRWGPMTYTVPGFSPGVPYIVRLHFSEQYFGADGHAGGVGSRLFNVAINGSRVLTNLDVFGQAGGANKALVIDNPATADANGKITIAFTNGAADNASADGIEILLEPGGTPGIVITGNESASASDALVDSVGVNVHLAEYGTLYGDNFGMISSLLSNAGIRHIRDGSQGSQLCGEVASLSGVGVRENVLSDGSIADLAAWLSCTGTTVESIEGINEAIS